MKIPGLKSIKDKKSRLTSANLANGLNIIQTTGIIDKTETWTSEMDSQAVNFHRLIGFILRDEDDSSVCVCSYIPQQYIFSEGSINIISS